MPFRRSASISSTNRDSSGGDSKPPSIRKEASTDGPQTDSPQSAVISLHPDTTEAPAPPPVAPVQVVLSPLPITMQDQSAVDLSSPIESSSPNMALRSQGTEVVNIGEEDQGAADVASGIAPERPAGLPETEVKSQGDGDVKAAEQNQEAVDVASGEGSERPAEMAVRSQGDMGKGGQDQEAADVASGTIPQRSAEVEETVAEHDPVVQAPATEVPPQVENQEPQPTILSPVAEERKADVEEQGQEAIDVAEPPTAAKKSSEPPEYPFPYPPVQTDVKTRPAEAVANDEQM